MQKDLAALKIPGQAISNNQGNDYKISYMQHKDERVL